MAEAPCTLASVGPSTAPGITSRERWRRGLDSSRRGRGWGGFPRAGTRSGCRRRPWRCWRWPPASRTRRRPRTPRGRCTRSPATGCGWFAIGSFGVRNSIGKGCCAMFRFFDKDSSLLAHRPRFGSRHDNETRFWFFSTVWVLWSSFGY